MPRGSCAYEDEGDESEDRDAMPSARRRQQPRTEHTRFDLGIRNTDGCEGEDGDNADADADVEEEASQADD